MANFEKQYSLRKIKQPTDKYLDDVKEVLVDKGVVLEDTPYDLMPDAITEGFVEIEEKEQALEDVKSILVNKGYADEDTPYSELDDVINASFVEVEPEWEKVLSQCEEFKVFPNANYTYKVVVNNYKGIYAVPSSGDGVVYIDCDTLEVTQVIESSFRKPSIFFKTSDGSIYVTSSNYNSTGICKINGLSSSRINFGSLTEDYGMSVFFEASDGTVYFFGRNDNFYKIVDNNVSLVCEGKYTSSSVYEYNGFIYFNLKQDSNYVLYCTNGQSTQAVYTDTKSVSFYSNKFFTDSKGNYYAYNSSIIRVDGFNTKVWYRGTATNEIFEDGKGNIYIKQYYASDPLLLLTEDGLVELTDTKNSIGSMYFSEDGTLYGTYNSSSGKLVKVEGETVTILENIAGTFEEIGDKVLIYGSSGLWIFNNGEVTKIDSINWNSSKYVKSNLYNRIYVYSGYTNNPPIITIEGEEVVKITAYRKLDYFTQDKDGKLYFTSSENPAKGAIVMEETENGLVQKIYRG